MRIVSLVACVAVLGCGDNRKGPNNNQPDAKTVDGRDIDMPIDMPQVGPVNLTNLTVQTGITLRADFVTPLFFSPDGTKVAAVANYSATVALPTRDEPHVVALDGSGVTRTVAIDAACGACDAVTLAWSADSASLFALGDLVVNNDTDTFKLDPAAASQVPTVATDAPTNGDAVNLFAVADGAATRVWVVGDWLTDNTRQAGAFAGDATLPFSTANPPPIIASGSLFAGTGSTANVFDARGNKIAYVGDPNVTGRFDLIVAGADGANPVTLVQGQANVEITAVALSPDGSKVAFTMDSVAINNGFDLYVVTTDGAGTPARLSPDRAVGSPAPDQQDVFFTFEWSRDSKFIAFSADMTENGFDQGYVVDTTAATPAAIEVLARADIAAQASGAQGIRGRLLFDAQNNIYFRARVSTDNNSQFKFFKAAPDGTRSELTLPQRGDASVPDIGAFGIAPDGTTLVFSSDTPDATAFNLYRQSL